MRTPLLFLGACVVSCTSALTPTTAAAQIPSQEYAGVYISTADEDYFTPCGIDGAGNSWSLRFRDNENQAPFLKKVTAVRGYPPLTHFIRIRGRLGPPGRYNAGFQTRELAVDSVLDVKESLEPCRGFGTPAAWSALRERFRNPQAIALSNDQRLVALLDDQWQVSIWTTATGQRISKFAVADKRNPQSGGGAQIAFSDDGQLLAVGGIDGIVRVWRPLEGKRVFSLALKDSAALAAEMAKIPPRPDTPGYRPPARPNSYAPARQIVFNGRGTMLAATNLFSTIVWSTKTGKKLAEFNIGNDFRRKVFFVGDEGLLMTADSGRMTLRSHLDAQPVAPPGIPVAEAYNVVMSPDRRVIAVGRDSVFLWPLTESRTPMPHIPGFATGVTAFSPDGNTVAIAGGMYGLYLYDMRTGAPIRAFHNFPGPVSGAWFTGDGKAIVTVSTFDDRFRIVYVDPAARPASQDIFDDSLTAQLPLGPPPSTSPRTVGGIVTGPSQRAVGSAEVTISNGNAPDSVIARTTTSPGGYFSFDGIRFRHVVIRVRKPGFAPGVKYIHVTRWEIGGPWGIELTPETRPAESAADKSH
jgi:WD40 repeat protein